MFLITACLWNRNGRHCHSSVTDERTEKLRNCLPSESAEDTHTSRSASLQGIIASLGLLGPFSKGFGLKRCLNMSNTGYPEGTETQNLATTCITKIALRLCRWISEAAFKVRRPQASLDMLLESTGPTEPAFGEFIMYGVKKRKTHVPQKLHSNHRELPEFPPRAKALSSAP